MDLADVLQNPPNLDDLSALIALGPFFQRLQHFRDDMLARVATKTLTATTPNMVGRSPKCLIAEVHLSQLRDGLACSDGFGCS
jgi:hypothetical protein